MKKPAKHLFVAGAVIAIALGFVLPAHASDKPDANKFKQEIELIIEQFLVNNPEVLLRALDNVEAYQIAQQAIMQAKAIQPVWDSLLSDKTVPSFGPVDAPVTVIEFFDYHCGFCKQAFKDVRELATTTDGSVRTIFIEFPILREESSNAARAALASARQGKYIEVHSAFMENRGILDDAQIDLLAARNGVDVDRMRKDMELPEIKDMLQSNAQMAQSIGVTGTPAFLINRKMVSGADMDRVRTLVKAGLETPS